MYIMVLNDGETFTDLPGCKMYSVPDGWDNERIEDAIKERSDGPNDANLIVVVKEY